MYSAQIFSQTTHDQCDLEGKERGIDFCKQRGLQAFGEDGQYWKSGDFFLSLPNDDSVSPSLYFIEAEIRGAEGSSPWVSTNNPNHPYKFNFDSVSIPGRKVLHSKSLLMISFDHSYRPNATITLISTARDQRFREDKLTVRGEDWFSRPPKDFAVLMHQNLEGLWYPCETCNPPFEDGSFTKSQYKIRNIFWPINA